MNFTVTNVLIAIYLVIAISFMKSYSSDELILDEIKQSKLPRWLACLVAAIVVILCGLIWPYMLIEEYADRADAEDEDSDSA